MHVVAVEEVDMLRGLGWYVAENICASSWSGRGAFTRPRAFISPAPAPHNRLQPVQSCRGGQIRAAAIRVT
jgi:hypothetical protein